MSEIRVLEDKVANQIAAGEVIERPAAVIKELLENSIDAGATRIQVEFRHGGKSYMRVEDNGCGMTADQAMLSLERHATSKIRKASDLSHIQTFGFRGEAVPSIASVSKFLLKTRPASLEVGCEVLVNGGKWIHKQDCGMAVGTRIEVSNLFNSVPVRRKFMKTDNTEAAHIIHLVRLYAISHPKIGFSLHEGTRLIFSSHPDSTLEDRISQIWSRKLSSELIAIHAEENGMELQGFVGKPGVSRATRNEIITFVNNRPVDSKTLNYALTESYHTHISKGKYPICFLFLKIDPAWVDVNVHPAKREVRFRQEGMIRHLVIRATLDALRSHIQEAHKTSFVRPNIPPVIEPKQEIKEIPASAPLPRLIAPVAIKMPVVQVPEPKVMALAPVAQESPKSKETPAPRPIAPKPPLSEPVPLKVVSQKKDWRLIGRLKSDYALFETSEGLVILNVRAAEQRVYYESIKREFADAKTLSQPLLFPISIELDPRHAQALKDNLSLLAKAGYEIEEFGRNFFRISALPDWMNPDQAEQFIKDASGVLLEEGSTRRTIEHSIVERLTKLAINAVRYTSKLNDEALEQLVEKLFQTENSMTSPRGKKIYLETTFSDIDGKFGV